MNCPDPQQQHEDNLELWMLVGLALVLWLAACGLMGTLCYVFNY